LCLTGYSSAQPGKFLFRSFPGTPWKQSNNPIFDPKLCGGHLDRLPAANPARPPPLVYKTPWPREKIEKRLPLVRNKLQLPAYPESCVKGENKFAQQGNDGFRVPRRMVAEPRF
jgi:hypothetical protein